MKLLISAVLVTGLLTTLPSFEVNANQFKLEQSLNLMMQENALQMNQQLASQLGRDVQMSLKKLQAPVLTNLKNKTLVVKNSSKNEITFTEE
ncbi:MAG: hypothetical protein HRT37_11670 [Alteromonadaceae bacterium]|nr:hypothetical protein [Alteromonadaceae bacterium]